MMRAEISILMENPADVLSDREVDEGKVVKSAARTCICLLRLYPALNSLSILFGYYLSTTQSTGALLVRLQEQCYQMDEDPAEMSTPVQRAVRTQGRQWLLAQGRPAERIQQQGRLMMRHEQAQWYEGKWRGADMR